MTQTTPDWIIAVDPALNDGETTIFNCLHCGWFGGEEDVSLHECSKEPNIREKL